jgi:hypothetical protein
VFPTASGSRRDKDNVRTRVIHPVVTRADELLAEHRAQPLPNGVTAHKLRHTFTSILFARGEDPAYVMAQYLDSAEQIAALLEAAADLNGRPTARTTGRRGLVATLVRHGRTPSSGRR